MSSLPPLTLPPPLVTFDTVPPQDDAQSISSQIPGQDGDEDDIFRGSRPDASPLQRVPSVAVSSASSSSTSSTSSRGWRRGPLAARIEQAISRWARRHNSSSSTTSSSSEDSGHTRSQTTGRRQGSARRARSRKQASVYSEQVPRPRFVAQVPREFTLFLPDSLSPTDSLNSTGRSKAQSQQRQMLRSTSLPLVLTQLESALKKRAKLRRTERRAARPHRPLRVSAIPSTQTIMETHEANGATPAETAGDSNRSSGTTTPQRSQITSHAWWLNVSSPTWDDLRTIGKLLHLHPLTLEDILVQDAREKLDVFTKLGYYFVVFQALAGAVSPKKNTQTGKGDQADAEKDVVEGDAEKPETTLKEAPQPPEPDGVVQAINVYMIVFKEGIITFHYGDISDHLETVRDRILQLEDSASLYADWIAHSLFDSIVDSFFPVLDVIETETDALSILCYGMGDAGHSELYDMRLDIDDDSSEGLNSDKESTTRSRRKGSIWNRLYSLMPTSLWKSTLKSFSERPWIRPIVRHIAKQRDRSKGRARSSFTTMATLMRMTSTRRLVTSLGKLLVGKSEVIGRIQKRLTLAGANRRLISNGYASEIQIYMGDVQDHILGLQQSLDHFEKILSQSHPAYLRYLRTQLGEAKAGLDIALVALYSVTIGIVLMQVVYGTFAMNLTLPFKAPDDPANFKRPIPFGVLVLISLGVTVIYAVILRYWWIQAERKSQARRRVIRGRN